MLLPQDHGLDCVGSRLQKRKENKTKTEAPKDK